MTFNEKVKNLNAMILTREALINNLTIEQIKKKVYIKENSVLLITSLVMKVDAQCLLILMLIIVIL